MKKLFFLILIIIFFSITQSASADVLFCPCDNVNNCVQLNSCSQVAGGQNACKCADGQVLPAATQTECNTICSQSSSTVEAFCECTNLQNCASNCVGYTGKNSCKCESGVTVPVDTQAECEQVCQEKYDKPSSAADNNYKICNCTVGTPYAEGDVCKKTCTKKDYENKTICACKDALDKSKLAISGSATEIDNDCKDFCKPTQPTTAATPTNTAAPEFGEAIRPKLSFPIPDLNLSKIQVPIGGQKSVQINMPWIAEYIIAIYKYSIGIASILAVIMVMIAGLIYLTSAGNPQRIGQAKNIIIGAISGLVILLSSYMILNLISPRLTQLGPVELATVKEEFFSEGDWEGLAVGVDDPNAPEVLAPLSPGACDFSSNKTGGHKFGVLNSNRSCRLQDIVDVAHTWGKCNIINSPNSCAFMVSRFLRNAGCKISGTSGSKPLLTKLEKQLGWQSMMITNNVARNLSTIPVGAVFDCNMNENRHITLSAGGGYIVESSPRHMRICNKLPGPDCPKDNKETYQKTSMIPACRKYDGGKYIVGYDAIDLNSGSSNQCVNGANRPARNKSFDIVVYPTLTQNEGTGCCKGDLWADNPQTTSEETCNKVLGGTWTAGACPNKQLTAKEIGQILVQQKKCAPKTVP